MINPYTNPRTRRKSHFILPVLCLLIFIIVFYPKDSNNNDGPTSTSNHYHEPTGKIVHKPPSHDKITTTTDASKSKTTSTNKSTFVPTLRGKKVFFEVSTVGLGQLSYLEDIIDSVRDICEAGAHVSFHITSSNCNPHPEPGDEPCVIKNQSSEDTEEDNFKVETISYLNERARCRNPEGSLDFNIHLVSPDWGKEIINHHRVLFYENIENDFDVFLHTEDDTLIRPTTVLAFMDEMEKLRLLVGNERLPDYSIGFMRFENEVTRDDRRRVVWEFEWGDELDMISHPGIEDSYFTSPPWHHQGMFMATKQQLLAWKNRGPECNFDKPVRREGYHIERTSGALDLYDVDYCNVTQLLPLDSFDDLLVHHLTNKNNQRSPSKILSLTDLHKRRIYKMQEVDPNKKIWANEFGEYDGIKIFKDERVEKHRMHFDLSEYEEYVKRGGRLTEEQVKYWSD